MERCVAFDHMTTVLLLHSLSLVLRVVFVHAVGPDRCGLKRKSQTIHHTATPTPQPPWQPQPCTIGASSILTSTCVDRVSFCQLPLLLRVISRTLMVVVVVVLLLLLLSCFSSPSPQLVFTLCCHDDGRLLGCCHCVLQ